MNEEACEQDVVLYNRMVETGCAEAAQLVDWQVAERAARARLRRRQIQREPTDEEVRRVYEEM